MLFEYWFDKIHKNNKKRKIKAGLSFWGLFDKNNVTKTKIFFIFHTAWKIMQDCAKTIKIYQYPVKFLEHENALSFK